MRKFLLLIVFLLGLLLIVGSSGNFRAYSTSRNAEFGVVGGNESYIGYRCMGNPVSLGAGSGVEFVAITVENLMDRPITIHVEADDSSLPDDLSAGVDGSTYTLEPGQSASIGGNFSAGNNAMGGTYEVLLTVYAEWDGGSAQISDCSMYASVETPYVLVKSIVGGVYAYPVGEWNSITLQLNFTNNGEEGDFVIKDVIPNPGWRAFYVVGLPRPSSERADLMMNHCHCGCSGWTIVWHVHVARRETVTLNIPMEAVFFSPGNYTLNFGAHLCGTDVVSNKITVTGGS